MLPPALAHLASLWAPVIRDVATKDGGADRPLQRPPLVPVEMSTPLPQFPVPFHLEAELTRAQWGEVSDTDPTRQWMAVDTSDSDPTLRIIDRSDTDRTLERPSSDAEATRRRPMSSMPPPVTLDATSELTDADLEDLQDLPAHDTRVSPDSTLDCLLTRNALRARHRARRSATRRLGFLAAAAAAVLGLGVLGIGRAAAASGDARSVITFSMASLAIPLPALAAAYDAEIAANEPRVDVDPIELTAASREIAVVAPPQQPAKPVAQPVGQSVSKPISKPIVKSILKPILKPISKPISKPTSKVVPTTGQLDTGSASSGHRVYVDGLLAGFAPSSIKMKCGAHSVRVGSGGKLQKIVIPCGGHVFVR